MGAELDEALLAGTGDAACSGGAAESSKKKKEKRTSKDKRRRGDGELDESGGGEDDEDDKNTKAQRGGVKAKLALVALLLLMVATVLSARGRRSGDEALAPPASSAAREAGGASAGRPRGASAEGDGDGVGEEGEEDAAADKGEGGEEEDKVQEKKKRRKARKKAEEGEEEEEKDEEGIDLGNVDVIESKFGSLGWTKTQGPLVSKRPPRECLVKRIPPQVVSPFYIASQKTSWQRRIYTCVRLNKQECATTLLDDFESRRWKLKPAGSALEDRVQSTFVLTDSVTLAKLRASKPEVFEELYVRNEGSTYLNALLGAEGLDGSTLQQFTRRWELAHQSGCSYNALKVQLPQFRYDVASECARMERAFGKRAAESWLLASFSAPEQDGGATPEGAAQVKPTTELEPAAVAIGAGAAEPSGRFCQEHARHESARRASKLASVVLPNPLKLEGKLFDVRGFLLIGSTIPMMAFFQQGYVRQHARAHAVSSPFLFDSGSEDIELDAFQSHLANSKITGSHYVDTFLKSSMKQIALFVFHASRTKIHRRRGSFQLFAVDYVVDATFRVYLEKTVGMPDLDATRRYDPGPMVADMHDLVQELHEVPVAFEGMVKGDKYGTWELIFSELSETCHKILYNPCHAFIDYNDQDLVKPNKKVGKVQATAKRLENEAKRIVKKTEEKKKETCRAQKVSYPGAKCNKLMEDLAQNEFNKLFKEHEESINPNDFRVPKPGEVMPHEIV